MTQSKPLTTQGGEICPVCDRAATPGATLPDYRLFRCPHCGCWSSDALVRGAVTSFEAEDYFENADVDRPKWGALFDRMKEEGKAIGSVLDVGCGTGAFLSFVAAEHPGTRCEGIEIDLDRAAQARSANPGTAIHSGDASEVLAGVTGPFDLITLWDVFEHVPAPVELLGQLGQLLAPGGAIHIVTIHERSLVPALGRLSYRVSGGRLTYPIRRTHEPHHLVFFTREGLDIGAERAGLQIRDLWFDRLRRGRMDGPALVTAATSLLLATENALGTGLFVNLLLEARS